ncbi:lipase 1-like [Teleopsis dalmanni]|uniref:lipase 1-like n=1 Tax=Teleopsis dalmanni TaxID=139649 RepID=UPI0018CDD742|nr:lipase 1-like [Teleopsis dalmanni]
MANYGFVLAQLSVNKPRKLKKWFRINCKIFCLFDKTPRNQSPVGPSSKMFTFRCFLSAAIVLSFNIRNGNGAMSYLQEHYPASVIEDTQLDTAQLLKKYGYPSETHYVTTSDKYILCMHRIARPKARPLLLMHGLTDSSATWVLLGPWSSLGYYLYDQGYDVWMGNVRGNRYSRNHTIYSPDKDRDFWSFSWHEIGYYDLPALIDYILQQTGYKKLGYFGHSQGTTSFWVLCSMRPEYNEKVSVMNALAPVAFMKHIKAPLLGLMRQLLKISGDIVRELLPHTDILLTNCFRSSAMLNTCLDYFHQIVGKEVKQLNMTTMPIIFAHVPAGSNRKQWEHYLQLIESDRFCQFDYGAKENKKRYGKAQPPDYPLDKITVPVGLYYTYNDYLSSEVDVQRLAKTLPNVAADVLYPHKKWNHITMVWGIEARQLAHKQMLDILQKYEID